ncbi:hypothetical protein [Winogradskyella immobilis]|uniref:Uncharacterized protein n=1 Tax=Winogradskyella immobilis TaxID=2816852 RepID=A0ABS8EJL4_9FLAO|nr:hypothetical protein [Winogradskyella immobilis]MCC1483384.1 hypothetical protein [Winogradskyella immobilis]MCG0015478.1 hypothetical protein [Winogradskyella immobilis]
MKTTLNNLKRFVGLCKKTVLSTISPKTDCSRKHNNDYYCDSEMPFIPNKNK